tara:strand:- start:4778 stop:6154 length:1377 start_codon:yes stop_codon:yes gene_type:complete
MKHKTRSIKGFLIRSMFASAFAAGILTIGVSYYFNLKDLRPFLDSQILLKNKLTLLHVSQLRDLSKESINSALSKEKISKDFSYDYKTTSNLVDQIINSTESIIWDSKNKLILSNNKHQIKTAPKLGFSYVDLAGELYRSYAVKLKQPDLTIVTLQKRDTRAIFESGIVTKFLYVFFAIYVILLITILVVLRKGIQLIEKACQLLEQKRADPKKRISGEDFPTEIQPLFASLNTLINQLEDTLLREKRFAADAAHELKTPLAAISAHLQVATITQDSEKQKQSIQSALASVTRSCQTVEQLLLLSKALPLIKESELEDVFIKEVIIGLMSDYPNIAINTDLVPDKASLRMDKNCLQILVNTIISNSHKFEASTLDVALTESDTEVSLTFTDNGPGVPDEHLHRLGERFFRVYGQDKDGSGIGLSIAQEIVHFHNGVLSFKNSKPSGLIVLAQFNRTKN